MLVPYVGCVPSDMRAESPPPPPLPYWNHQKSSAAASSTKKTAMPIFSPSDESGLLLVPGVPPLEAPCQLVRKLASSECAQPVQACIPTSAVACMYVCMLACMHARAVPLLPFDLVSMEQACAHSGMSRRLFSKSVSTSTSSLPTTHPQIYAYHIFIVSLGFVYAIVCVYARSHTSMHNTGNVGTQVVHLHT